MNRRVLLWLLAGWVLGMATAFAASGAFYEYRLTEISQAAALVNQEGWTLDGPLASRDTFGYVLLKRVRSPFNSPTVIATRTPFPATTGPAATTAPVPSSR